MRTPNPPPPPPTSGLLGPTRSTAGEAPEAVVAEVGVGAEVGVEVGVEAEAVVHQVGPEPGLGAGRWTRDARSTRVLMNWTSLGIQKSVLMERR